MLSKDTIGKLEGVFRSEIFLNGKRGHLIGAIEDKYSCAISAKAESPTIISWFFSRSF